MFRNIYLIYFQYIKTECNRTNIVKNNLEVYNQYHFTFNMPNTQALEKQNLNYMK